MIFTQMKETHPACNDPQMLEAFEQFIVVALAAEQQNGDSRIVGFTHLGLLEILG